MIAPATAHGPYRPRYASGSNRSFHAPAAIEYGFYALILYGLVPFTWLPTPPLAGAALNAALAAWCLVRFGPRTFAPIGLPLACSLSYIALQVTFHGEALTGEYVRPFGVWMFRLIVIHTLSTRPGFLDRFARASLVIGALLLPYVTFAPEADFGRAGLASTTGLSNPNDLAAWFGFLSVYFIVAGIESKRNLGRLPSWMLAMGCLGVVGLTVSRGTLLAVCVGTVVAARRLLKGGFAPVLLLLSLVSLAYFFGFFEMATSSYMARAAEETGRFLVWPLAVARFFESPLIGYGASNVVTYVPAVGRAITPHNGFLFLAVASGIVPVALFAAYWWRAARAAFSSRGEAAPDAPFRLPLVLYAFLIIQAGNMTFMEVWVIATLALSGTSLPSVRRVITRRMVPQHHRVSAPYAG